MKTRLMPIAAVVATLLLGSPAHLAAHETDQFRQRSADIADSTEVLNREVNRAINDAVDKRHKDDAQMKIVNAIFRRLGSRMLVDRLERWAIKSPEVDKIDAGRYGSVYSGHPVWAVRVTKLFGVNKTIRVNDELIGTDKLGHFVSQGRKFYRRFLRMDSETQAARQSAFAEWAVFGQMSNGNFSNADLVANYEGHRFYRSLFEDDIIPGKPSILYWDGERWVMQRPFDWADHVNEYWDEALNVNHFDALLYKHMHKRFISYCPDYWSNPSLYTIVDEQQLRDRYAHLGMKDNSVLRLDSLCPVQVYLATGTAVVSNAPSANR